MKYIFFLFILFLPVGEAKAEDLAYSKEWLALGHYKKKIFGGYKSTIDTKNFFVSENGKISPEEELKATVELFNSDDDEKKCLFPARYKFLKSQDFTLSKFPNCLEYNKFVKDLSPAGVTLLFTDAYMNNPSSLFGHTLFRIDTSRKGTQLLAHGANYGAFTGDDGGALFAVKGLAGGYLGGFTVKPYYDVINMYNNIENRDIWELQLNFDDEELDMFVAHLWEVGHAQTRYYFFTQNCSYMLMEILDAVRPDLRLSDQFWYHTIPLDTFKAVAAREGMVKKLSYRPSRQSKIINQYNQMNYKQKSALGEVIQDRGFEMKGLSEQEKAGVVDTAYQYLQYQNVERKVDRQDYRKRSFRLLTERNKIKEDDGFEPLVNGKSPLKAHESKRAGLGFGWRNGRAFQQVEYHPAYHSLLDNGYGYLRGAEINFLNVSARHYDNDNKFVLQSFDLVGIKSLSPVNEMFSPISYDVALGIKREFDPSNEDEGYVFYLRMAAGATIALADNVWAYGMVSNHFNYGGFLPRNQWAGVGVVGGVYADFGKFRVLEEVEKVWATSRFGDRIKYKAEVSYSFGVNHSVAASYSFEGNRGRNLSEPMINYRFHF